MTASAPSYTALATSDASARVGTGDATIDSSICVATTTGLPAARQARTMRFWIGGTRSGGARSGEAGATSDDFGAQPPVVEQQVRAGIQRRENLGMRQWRAARVAAGLIQVEPERVAGLQCDRSPAERADAQLGALQVDQH